MKIDLLEEKELTLKLNLGLEKQNEGKHRGYLGMSEIGDPCTRRLWLHYHKYPSSIPGQRYRAFAYGHWAEQRLIGELIDAGYKVENSQMEFKDYEGQFQGHCDGVIFYRNSSRILEIKTVNDASFKKFQNGGCRSNSRYYGQVQLYMLYSGLSKCLFIVENKNNQDLFVERVDFYEPEALRLYTLAGKILTQPEPDPPLTETGPCWLCDVKSSCQNFDELRKSESCVNCVHYRPTDTRKHYQDLMSAKAKEWVAGYQAENKVNITKISAQFDILSANLPWRQKAIEHSLLQLKKLRSCPDPEKMFEDIIYPSLTDISEDGDVVLPTDNWCGYFSHSVEITRSDRKCPDYQRN